jgi:hypothetical protein
MNDLLLNFIAQSNECSLTRSGKVFLIPFWEISYRGSRLKIQEYSDRYLISRWNVQFKRPFFAAYKTAKTSLEVIEVLKAYN